MGPFLENVCAPFGASCGVALPGFRYHKPVLRRRFAALRHYNVNDHKRRALSPAFPNPGVTVHVRAAREFVPQAMTIGKRANASFRLNFWPFTQRGLYRYQA